MWQRNDIVNAPSLNKQTEDIIRSMVGRKFPGAAASILQQMRPILCVNRTGSVVSPYYANHRLAAPGDTTDDIPAIVSSGGQFDFYTGSLVVPADRIANGETGYCWVEGLAIIRMCSMSADTKRPELGRYMHKDERNSLLNTSYNYGSNCPILMYTEYNYTQYGLVNINPGTKRRYEYHLSTSAFGFTRDDRGGDEYWPDGQYPPIEYVQVDHPQRLYYTGLYTATHNKPFGTRLEPVWSETGEQGTWASLNSIVQPGEYIGVRNYGINANPRQLIVSLSFSEV